MIFTNEQKEFILQYAQCLKNGCASVFLGSGFSRKSGYKGWSELLSKYARRIGLKIAKEQNDLISLAQYYVNSVHDTNELKKYICSVFSPEPNKHFNENHLLISSLPLQSYWTTNYDTLIEQVLDYRGLRFNKIIWDTDLRKKDNSAPLWLYKMHGDVGDFKSIIITKQDYENYYDKYEMMIAKLKSEICTKTFLFLGYSISDPNVMHILARARKVFDKNKGRLHYAIMERPHEFLDDGRKNREYPYQIIKQQHQIADLAEYGIKVILVDNYDQITEILKALLNIVYEKNVLISGTFENETKNSEQIGKLTESLALWLITNNYRIFTGYGKNLGQRLVAGAFDGCQLKTTSELIVQEIPDVVSINQRVVNAFSDKVFLFPFPYDTALTDNERNDVYARLRHNMVASTRITIIICGEKYKDAKSNSLIRADGVIQEYEISKQHGNIIIPIAITGGVADDIWEILHNSDNEFYQSDPFIRLKYANTFEDALTAVYDSLTFCFEHDINFS